ncbi:MAG: hypothetical protein EBW30_08905 [Synechococcaceae bacterium WB7_3xG_012]|nr:hypothetical protein [Synechococcaceae bacterium WB7_3xG_012]
MTSLSFFRQGFTGITAAALAGSSLLAITSNAQAASLDYDCFSRQTGELLVKSAVDGIKGAIGTAKDVSEIAGYIDQLFEGEKQVQQKRANSRKRHGWDAAKEL